MDTPLISSRHRAHHWSYLPLLIGLLLSALLAIALTLTLFWQEAPSARLAQAVTAADLVALKEARLEASEAFAFPALPRPVTAAGLVALKENRLNVNQPYGRP